MEDIKYVKKVTVGSVNPNAPFSSMQHDEQLALLNKCLSEFPRGQIIGKDISIGSFQVGEHQLTTECVTYHIGFTRVPAWLTK